MRKAASITVFTTILVLFGGGLSYATPAREISKTAVRESISPEALAQAITELKAAGIPHETGYHADGIRTTSRFEQGFPFTFVEPASSPVISAFIGGGWDWGKGPYIVLNKFDRDLILRGSGGLLTAAICRIPAVGWAACSVAGTIIQSIAGELTKNDNLCRGKSMKARLSFPYFAGCV